ILRLDDLDKILELERALLAKDGQLDELELSMQEWSARWRTEQLNHYLPTGWSFGLFDKDQKLHAYSLGQVLIYYKGNTQTLWVERFQYTNKENLTTLIEMNYRFAREKHLQRVLTDQALDDADSFDAFQFKSEDSVYLARKTTKGT
ncbi:MAG: hypothetical protein AB8E15_05655, partial [Bdellovibrionales bacterium]